MAIIDESNLGIDIAIADGDLARSLQDLAVSKGVDNAIAAFIRELCTPIGLLARYVYDADGLKTIDEEYGNGAYLMLSEPFTSGWVEQVIEYIEEIGEAQPRVTVLGVDFDFLDVALRSVRFTIRFEVLEEPKPFNLVLESSGRTINAVTVGVA